MDTAVAHIEPDWSREAKPALAWDPGRSLIASIRSYQKYRVRRGVLAALLRKISTAKYRFWSAVSGAEIPLNCRVEGGLMLPHPNGVVFHPDARVGPNCLVLQQVTLAVGDGGAPHLVGNAMIGAGAKIIGGVRIGSGAQIGANAVVLCDVPDNATAVGVPARIIDRPRH